MALLTASLTGHQDPTQDHYSYDDPPSETYFFRDEPAAPTVRTQIPGPISKQYIKELDEVFDTRGLNMLTDFTRSIGNYIADPDGNVLLDV